MLLRALLALIALAAAAAAVLPRPGEAADLSRPAPRSASMPARQPAAPPPRGGAGEVESPVIPPAARAAALGETGAPSPHRWLPGPARELLADRLGTPAGATRRADAAGSFGEWLRTLPVLPAGAPVVLFDGSLAERQDAHVAVVDLDVGAADLQQCADAVMRLRAEYLAQAGRADEICFRGVDGRVLRYTASSGRSLRRWLDGVYDRANTGSLARQLEVVATATDVQIGDVYLQAGNGRRYGHAALVVDLAVAGDGARFVALAQSYMPAQSVHVLESPSDEGSPWHRVRADGAMVTATWEFPAGSLRRFPVGECGR